MRGLTTALLGALCGLLIGWLLRPLEARGSRAEEASTPRSSTPEQGPRDATLSEPPPSDSRRTANTRSAQPTSTAKGPREVPLFHEGLAAYGSAEITKGWLQARGDAIPGPRLEEGLLLYERTVMEAPAQIGSRLAANQDQRDLASGLALEGDPLKLLSTLDAGGGPLESFVQDGEAFSNLFQRLHPSLELDASEQADDAKSLSEVLENGATLRFPAGVFLLELNRATRSLGSFPEDLALRGAGMDRTLLVLREDLGPRSDLRGLRIADCTIYTQNRALTDVRAGRRTTLYFERARFVGFDSGAGGSAWINASPTALYARHCTIEGGYGRGRDGTLFDVRTSGFLARFEACTIRDTGLGTDHFHGGTLVFANCTLTGILGRPERTEVEGVVFVGGSLEFAPKGTHRAPSKDLDDLFPGWQEQLR